MGTNLCPFKLTVKWDSFGFYITLEKSSYGCPNHENDIKGDLSKLTLPMRLIPEKEKQILQSMSDACIGPAVGRNYIFSRLGKFITRSQLASLLPSRLSHWLMGLKNWIQIFC
jgi:hypothetical protein